MDKDEKGRSLDPPSASQNTSMNFSKSYKYSSPKLKIRCAATGPAQLRSQHSLLDPILLTCATNKVLC